MRAGLLLLLCLVIAQANAIEIQHWNTRNGVPVYFIETHNLPIVDMRLSFHAASSRDGNLPGLAGLVNGLLVEGTEDLSAQQVASGFEQFGARFSHRAGRDIAWTGLRSLSDHDILDVVVDLFARVTALPNFTQSALDRDREALLVNLGSRQKRIDALASDHFNQALYQGHPYQYGSLGRADALQTVQLRDVISFHQRFYVAKNASLAIIGDLTLEDARAYANQISAYLPEGESVDDILEPTATQGKTIRVDFDSEQTQVKVGMPVLSRFDPDYYALIVGNHILGGNGSNSRLMQNIREKHGLAYNAYSFFIPLQARGPFEMGLQTRNDQVAEALTLLDQTLQQFIEQGPDDTELALARKNIIAGFAMRLDSNRKMLNQLSVIGFYKLPLDYLDQYPRHIEAISADVIRRAFQDRVKPDQMIRVIVGPQEVLE